MRSLDTNVILRLLLRDVPDQSAKISSMLAEAKPNSFFVADAVLFETAWVLSGSVFSFDRKAVGDMLLQITKIPQINCNRLLLQKAVPLYKAKTNLSFIDVCMAVYAELNDAAPLLTFDKQLANKLPKQVQLIT